MEEKKSLPVIEEQFEPSPKPQEKESKNKNKKKLKINIFGFNDFGKICSNLNKFWQANQKLNKSRNMMFLITSILTTNS